MNDAPDFAAATARQQATWSEGDFSMVGAHIAFASERLAEALELMPGERVLDVACGSGNGAIAAARRSWVPVTGLDFVPALLERARERAAAERLELELVAGDAQELPSEAGAFDVTMSIYGAMFAPDQERAGAELLRVTNPGGRIGMANWTPDGGVGQMFLTRAFAAGDPAKVSVVGLSQVVFSLLIDIAVTHQEVTEPALIGTLLIIAPTAWVMLERRPRRQAELQPAGSSPDLALAADSADDMPSVQS